MDVVNNIESIVMKIKKSGYCFIENYWSQEQCKKAIEEINTLRKQRNFFTESLTYIDSSGILISKGGDLRCRKSNLILSTAKFFYEDEKLRNVAKSYSQCSKPGDIMCNLLEYDEKTKKNSGGEWHCDTKDRLQLKAILYLTDVNEKNGPFSIIPFSKKYIQDDSFIRKTNLRLKKSFIEKFQKKDIIELIGSQGSLILVDTSIPHRGKIIEEGHRYAYTFYFYDE